MMRLASLAILLVASALPAQASLAELVGRLGETQNRDRYQAYRELNRRRDAAAVPLLLAGLDGFPLHGQSLGFNLLQSLPGQQEDRRFHRLLRSKSAYLRLCAGGYLAQRRDPAGAPVVVATLAEKLDRETLRLGLSRVLYVPDPGVGKAILALLEPGVDRSVLDHCIRYLNRNPTPGAREAVAGLLQAGKLDKQREMQCRAFLLRAGDQAQSAPLAELIRGGVRDFNSLRDDLSAAPRLSRELLDVLVEQIDQLKGHQLRALVQILARHRHQAAVPKLRDLLADPDQATAEAAFQGLRSIPGGMDDRYLRQLLRQGVPALKIRAADALRLRDDHAGLPALLELRGKAGKDEAELVRVLAGFRVRKVVEPLLEAMLHSDLQVRRNAESGLNRLLTALLPYRSLDLASTGYRAQGAAAPRQAAVQRIRTWWQGLKR